MRGCNFICKGGVRLINAFKFIVDNNVGKLVKWLRIMGKVAKDNGVR